MRTCCFAILFLTCPFVLRGDESAPPEFTVGAYYYPWYDTDGRHWREGYLGESKGRQPALGLYSSRKAEVIRQHAEWSSGMGIDYWICSWWGPGSWEDESLRDHVAPELLAIGESGPKFCLFYESPLLGMDKESGIDFDLPQNVRRFAEHFRYLSRTFLDHPRYLRFEGRPVVFLYLTRTYTGNYENALTRARAAAEAQGLQLFLVGDEVYWSDPDEKRIRLLDGITPYNMHGPLSFALTKDWTNFVSQSESVYQTYRDAATRLGVRFLPGTMPGFDSRDAGSSHYPIPRQIRKGANDFSTFRAFTDMALRFQDPRRPSLVVTSFNEWHEGTQLEPFEGDDTSAKLQEIRTILKPSAPR